MNFAQILLRRDFNNLIQNNANEQRVFGRVVIQLENIQLPIFFALANPGFEVIRARIAFFIKAELAIKR